MLQGERLSELRKDHNHTQEDLAKILCVSKFTVSSWEQMRSNVPIPLLMQICDLYNVSADYLLGRVDWSPDISSQHYLQFTEEERQKIKEYEQFLLFQRKNKKSAGIK